MTNGQCIRLRLSVTIIQSPGTGSMCCVEQNILPSIFLPLLRSMNGQPTSKLVGKPDKTSSQITFLVVGSPRQKDKIAHSILVTSFLARSLAYTTPLVGKSRVTCDRLMSHP